MREKEKFGLKRMPSSIKRLLLAVMFLALGASAVACSGTADGVDGGAGGGGNGDGDGKLRVTATIGMIADIAGEVGGDDIVVTGLMPAGVDPHLYRAKQSDIRKLDQADVIFYNGLYLEGKMAEILASMSGKKPVVAVAERVPKELLHQGGPDGGDEYDPHVWFNVEYWMMAVEQVRDSLIQYDAGNADGYEKRAADYLAELEELHAYVKEQIALIPEQQRVLVTAHDAFGYFGTAYGMEVKALQGLSTASEAGTRDVMELRDFLVERGIGAVFVESSISPEFLEAVIQGAKEKGHTVTVGGELFSDAMGEPDTPEGTYIGMVRHNVDTIVKALR